MKLFYPAGTANFPRQFTDRFFIDYENRFEFSEITHKTAKFTEKSQLLDTGLWIDFARQFEGTPDAADLGWRCEYWGKMMRGACLVYSYTKNPELLGVLSATVRHIMMLQDERGRISTYPVSDEFKGWDMWGRKYVLLGMQYFLEINDDEELKDEIITSMCRQVDYLIGKIGKGEGKLPITRTSKHWYGLNSSSVLEPVVRLYNITGEKRYLDFAQYIADEGATYAENIFRLAEKKQLRLYQYPVTKAYEMTSCFEGLLELYRVTETEWYKTALINFSDLILEDELTVIGSAGCTHELFDHSFVRQANTTNYRVMQETCVTVTLMKFFLQMNLLTADPKYMDAFETAYYNAYLGSVNTEMSISSVMAEEYPHLKARPLPFDSYSPLTSGVRGGGIGGFKEMEGGKYYGCCVCIASAGVGLVPKAACLSGTDGTVINMYIAGSILTRTPSGAELKIVTDTRYPADGTVKLTVYPEKAEHFTLYLRNPDWSETTSVSVNGEAVAPAQGYVSINREWKEGDEVEIALDMRARVIYPTPYGSQVLMNKVIWGENSMTVPTYDVEDPEAKYHFALKRGPLMLAQDSRLGYDPDTAIEPETVNGLAELEETAVGFDVLFAADLPLKNGEKMTLCDYSSAGKLWSEKSKTAVWIKSISVRQ